MLKVSITSDFPTEHITDVIEQLKGPGTYYIVPEEEWEGTLALATTYLQLVEADGYIKRTPRIIEEAEDEET
jgi:hypothetical protein